MTKFTKGQAVKFERNSAVKSDSTIIIAIVDELENTINEDSTYVIEYINGWMPNSFRAKRFGLDVNKKYLFVSEKELTLI
jgi:hypothetical protein